MEKGLLGFLLVVFLTSCAMPETRTYSLHMPDPGSGASSAKTDASVAVVIDSPKYLSQPYIAYRNSPYELMISRYSKWDSSPEDIVKDGFRDALSSLGLFKNVRASDVVPSGYYRLTINLKKFERSDEGDSSFSDLALDVTLVSPEGKSLYRNTVSKRVKLADRSFLSLAKGLSGALAEGIEEVRVNVEKSLRQ
ncbi:MAG: membrane integrity-associated transporter subunit PqiC [Deltaproteobacteria bacterium]|nr:membrane integrity-associated transporter subunit PqiC [Deltaproteobacteria bacterium]